MYNFEGDYRRTPQQNLAGASRKTGKDELIVRAHVERQKRHDERRKHASSIVIQAYVRGHLTRVALRKLRRMEFDQKMSDMVNDECRNVAGIMYALSRVNYLDSSIASDRERCAELSKLVVEHRHGLLTYVANVEEKQICVNSLLSKSLEIIALYDRGDPVHSELAIAVISLFTCVSDIKDFTSASQSKSMLEKSFKHLMKCGYFGVMLHILKCDYDRGVFELRSQIGTVFIMRAVTSFPHVTESTYRLIVFELVRMLTSSEELHPVLSNCILPLLKQIRINFRLLVEAMTALQNHNCVALFVLLYLDDPRRVDLYKEYFDLLSRLTFNLVRISPAYMRGESPVDDDDEIVVGNFAESRILNECLNLLNVEARAEAWIKVVDQLIQNGEHQTLLNFTKCLHHIWLSGDVPIYYHRIFLLLTYHREYLKGLWQSIIELRSSNALSDPHPLITMLARGLLLNAKEAQEIIPMLTMFCHFLKFSLSVLPDEEFYTEEAYALNATKPFKLSELLSLSKTLKDIAVGLIILAYPDTQHGVGHDQCIQNYAPTIDVPYNVICWTHLMEVVVSLVSLLHDRDLRKQYTRDDQHWLSSFVSNITEDVPVYDSDKIIQSKPFRCSLTFPRKTLDGQRRLSAYESRTIRLLNSIPFIVPFLKRVSILHSQVELVKFEYQNPDIHVFHNPHVHIRIRRDYIYEDSFEKLSVENVPEMKITLRVQLTSTLGLEEAGVDGGGVFREFMLEFMKTTFDPNRGFFVTNTNNELYPNPNVHIVYHDYEKHYFFIGRMLGKAIFENILIDVPLTEFFLAYLTGDSSQICLSNLSSLDPDMYKNITNLRRYNGDFSELGLDFTILANEYGKSTCKELKPNGSEIPVTAENVVEYIHLIARYKMRDEIERQAKCFMWGIASVIPLEWLRMFSPRELQNVISGNESPIDVEDMRSHTTYSGGFASDHPSVIMFWRVVSNFTDQEKTMLLKFVTSLSRPPLLGFKELYPPFCIQNVEGCDRLPTSSTCMHLLKLPLFTDEETLRNKLLFAIYSGSGFELS